MKKKKKAEASREEQFRAWREITCQEWPEARVIERPVSDRLDPAVLVRRTAGQISGVRGEELVVLEGLPAISLFTGCGGMDIGLEEAGFVCLCQREWNRDACQTLILNRPKYFRHAALIQGDIYQTPTTMLLREAGLYVGECHIITGGPPCQGFSTSNSAAWVRGWDARNDLVFQFLRVLREAQPRFFLMENVPGFTRFNKGAYLKAFLEAAFEGGYELVYALANAVEYGVPQARCRFLCMGTRRDLVEIDGLLGSLPAPVTFGADDLERLRLLEGVDGLEAEAERARIRRAPGIRYFPGRPVLVPPNPAGEGERSATFRRFYDRIEKDEPDRIVRMPRPERRAA